MSSTQTAESSAQRSPMKVGVLQFFSWTRRVPLETVYQRAFERVAIMDEGGYDAVWLAEHHFNTYSICPSVTLMGTHIGPDEEPAYRNSRDARRVLSPA